jgi:hypothetical protein
MGLSGRAAADVRLLRASVFAGVCVLLAAAGHQWAGGRPPGTGALVAGWLGVLAWVVPLAGRRRTVPGVAAGLAAGQFALHAFFCLMCAPVTGLASASASGSASGIGSGAVAGSVSGTGPGSGPFPGSGVLTLAARLRCGGLGTPLTTAQAASVVRRAGLDPAMPSAWMPGMPGTSGTSGTSAMSAMSAMHGMPGMGGTGGMAGMHGTLPALLGTRLAVPTRPGDLLHLLPSPAMALAHLVAGALLGLVLWRGDAALWLLTARPAKAALRRLLGAFTSGLRALAAVAGAAEAVRRLRRAAHRQRRHGPRRPRPAAAPAVRRGPPRYAVAV